QFTENKPEASQKSSEIQADAHIKVAEASESVSFSPAVPESNADLSQEDIEFKLKSAGLSDNALAESEKQVESKKNPETLTDAPEQDILNSAAEGHYAPEPLGAEILEIAEAGAQLSPETAPPVDKVAAQAPSSPMQGGSPAVTQEKKPEPKAATESKDSDEAILLTPNDEVNFPSKGVLDSGDETALKDTADPIRDPNKAETDTKVTPPEDQVNAKAEATPKPAEMQSPPKILKIERAAHDMWDALKKQKAVITKARNQKKAKLELARADAAKRKKEAVARYRALKKERKSQAGVEILKKEKPAGTNRETKDHHLTNDRGLEAKTKIVGLLNRYEGKAIGINYDNSAEIKEAKFVAANEEFFSVFVKEKELHYSYPLKTILTVVEGKDGVGGSDPQQKVKFNAVIKVQPFVL
ncbi:MAG: hypothetical protein KJO34_18895, partial [Deltaproteobacteria bacterium]|nr:hypothetical protein [Deltaproteobacteria bacterium]